MKNNKKMGRPLTSYGARDIRFTVRFSKKEHEELIKKAQKKEMGLAEYIRYLIKKD